MNGRAALGHFGSNLRALERDNLLRASRVRAYMRILRARKV